MHDEDDTLAHHLMLHDPGVEDCPASHLGVPLTILPIEAVTIQDGDHAQIAPRMRLVRQDADVPVADWTSLDLTFPALVF